MQDRHVQAMRQLVWVLAFVGVALSGCAESTDAEESSDAVPQSEPGVEGSSPQAAEPGAAPGSQVSEAPSNGSIPQPPVAELHASVLEGTAPLTVVFGLNGTDADGDALSWSLDIDSDGLAEYEGSALPSSAEHTFDAGGYAVTLSVTDGTHVVNVTTNITAFPMEVAASGWTFTGDVDGPCGTRCGTVRGHTCEDFMDGTPNGNCVWFEMPEEAIGQSFTIESTAGDPDAQFVETCDFSSNSPVVAAQERVQGNHYYAEFGPEAGTVPEDFACVIIWEFNDGASTITMNIE